MTKELDEYFENVFKYLEYINYPELVYGYDFNDVSESIAGTIFICYNTEQSFRMAAIIIFSMIMVHKIIPEMQANTRH